eukprot:Gregarina_sp_Poly_1__7181@NODE_393_length_8957_cov_1164_871316_g322_i0_p6_GENE_NODE_393_length_8957_cov_1164_871316_g322_i0NODE_393_length_8957_cov_1164_871316_g322_i0_p6_ORF_typecomplete_len156_score5_01_NODE_393_length_8957_cov_1164_871316_g322_i054365903
MWRETEKLQTTTHKFQCGDFRAGCGQITQEEGNADHHVHGSASLHAKNSWFSRGYIFSDQEPYELGRLRSQLSFLFHSPGSTHTVPSPTHPDSENRPPSCLGLNSTRCQFLDNCNLKTFEKYASCRTSHNNDRYPFWLSKFFDIKNAPIYTRRLV